MKDEQAFNEFCKKTMGYIRDCPTNYNPYNDLNQLAPVVEKLIIIWRCSPFRVGSSQWKRADFVSELLVLMNAEISHGKEIKIAFRQFIINCMEEK